MRLTVKVRERWEKITFGQFGLVWILSWPFPPVHAAFLVICNPFRALSGPFGRFLVVFFAVYIPHVWAMLEATSCALHHRHKTASARCNGMARRSNRLPTQPRP